MADGLTSPARTRLKPWMLVSAAWLIPAGFAALDHVAQAQLHGDPISLRELLFSSGDWFLYAFLTPGVFAISRRWPITRATLWRGIAKHVGVAILFCIVWAVSGKFLQLGLGLLITPDEVHKFIAEAGDKFWLVAATDIVGWIFTTFPFGIAVYLCLVGIEHATRYFVEVREREVQVARLSEQLTGARLAALQAQLNPHFLFNSLNTVTVLVRDGETQAATRVLEQLSDVLRTTLAQSRENEVTLEDELDLVRQYLAVEQARFSDRLRPSIDVDPALLSAAVPSFAVQHLVENAIRHGIGQRMESGAVAIAARRVGDMLELTVSDDGVGVDPTAPVPDARGIANTRERLRTLYGERASLTLEPATAFAFARGTMARLRVPYHEVALQPAPDVAR